MQHAGCCYCRHGHGASVPEQPGPNGAGAARPLQRRCICLHFFGIQLRWAPAARVRPHRCLASCYAIILKTCTLQEHYAARSHCGSQVNTSARQVTHACCHVQACAGEGAACARPAAAVVLDRSVTADSRGGCAVRICLARCTVSGSAAGGVGLWRTLESGASPRLRLLRAAPLCFQLLPLAGAHHHLKKECTPFPCLFAEHCLNNGNTGLALQNSVPYLALYSCRSCHKLYFAKRAFLCMFAHSFCLINWQCPQNRKCVGVTADDNVVGFFF